MKEASSPSPNESIHNGNCDQNHTRTEQNGGQVATTGSQRIQKPQADDQHEGDADDCERQ